MAKSAKKLEKLLRNSEKQLQAAKRNKDAALIKYFEDDIAWVKAQQAISRNNFSGYDAPHYFHVRRPEPIS